MSGTILTLFGEEAVPEQAKAVGKPKATVASKEKKKVAAPVAPSVPEELDIPAEANEAIAVLQGWQPEKQYYTIGEVAGLFNVRTSHIRFWTKEFNLKVRTTRKGDRLYTPEQIMQVRTIYHLLKEKRFTIKGAKGKLKEDKKPSVSAPDIKQSLLHLRSRLLEIRNGLA
jgi:DNA-binding transcriptional MerR regulator